jgi:SAM-dependent methyltransferase
MTVNVPDTTTQDNLGSRNMWGHDIRFCRLMAEAGYKVYVDGRVLCAHVDYKSNEIFRLPAGSPPFQRGENINNSFYWDKVYGEESDASIWRIYPEIFERVCQEIPDGASILEIGCGTGILGSRVTATKQVKYSGLDISPVAVAIAKTRFLSCRQSQVRDLTMADFETHDVVVATEVVEHLDPDDRDHLLALVDAAPNVRRFVFSVPNNCMSPDELPEHTAIYTREDVETLVRQKLPNFTNFSIETPEPVHMLVVCTK